MAIDLSQKILALEKFAEGAASEIDRLQKLPTEVERRIGNVEAELKKGQS